jgi:hypothetical protein
MPEVNRREFVAVRVAALERDCARFVAPFYFNFSRGTFVALLGASSLLDGTTV